MSDKALQKINQQSAQSVTVKIEPFTTKIGAERPTELEDRSNTYVVGVINLSDNCLVLGRVDGGAWFAIPTVCRTCSTNYDTCFDQQKWTVVFQCQCTDRPFNLTLATKPDDHGNATGGTWHVTPDCSVAGGIVGMNP